MQELAGLGGNVLFCKMEVQTEVYQQIVSEFVSHMTQMRHTHTHTHACMRKYTCIHARTHVHKHAHCTYINEVCMYKHENDEIDKGDSTCGAAHTCLGTYLCTYTIHIRTVYST